MSNCSCSFFPICFKMLCEENKPSNVCDVGYIYNLELDATVDVNEGDPILFTGTAITRGGITHDASSPATQANINIANPGLYEVIFYVNGGSQNVASLQLNFETPIPSRQTYKNNAEEAIYGHAFIEVTGPSILRVIARTDLKLAKTNDGDPVSVNASVIIIKICSS